MAFYTFNMGLVTKLGSFIISIVLIVVGEKTLYKRFFLQDHPNARLRCQTLTLIRHHKRSAERWPWKPEPAKECVKLEIGSFQQNTFCLFPTVNCRSLW